MSLENGLKMVLYRFVVVFCLSFSYSFGAKLDLSQGAEVDFETKSRPSMLSIRGTGSKAIGSVEITGNKVKGELAVDLTKFTTDMDLRDEHVKEKYLETSKPGNDKAILKIDQKDVKDLPNPLKGNWKSKSLKGMLTLHGVTKEVELESNLNFDEAAAQGIVNFKVRLAEFGIETPSFAGVTVTDDVSITVHVKHKIIH